MYELLSGADNWHRLSRATADFSEQGRPEVVAHEQQAMGYRQAAAYFPPVVARVGHILCLTAELLAIDANLGDGANQC